eukprot:TRINITY_DN19025_c0_g1_i2.p1 TRINITY_DN19025_c0_g1~~TRINITY_DN19025_c0_g1_i2.p1  ORF type:complete len:172 (-),score=8.63 TRINITY_DN19025_c0_g1_i2:164-679(-)
MDRNDCNLSDMVTNSTVHLSDMVTNSTAQPQQRLRSLPELQTSPQSSSVTGANFQLNKDGRRISEITQNPYQRRKSPFKWIAIILNAGLLICGSIVIFKQRIKIQHQSKGVSNFNQEIFNLKKQVADLNNSKTYAIRQYEDQKKMNIDLLNYISKKDKKIEELENKLQRNQ